MSQELIKKYRIKAKKSLGQNFLVNDEIVEEISQIVEVQNQNIVEVGPGYGALTQKLLEQKPKTLDLVELDQDMIDILNDRIEQNTLNVDAIDFQIHKKDVLKFTPKTKDYSVIANIPYYITSPILKHFLYQLENKPKSMVILMQKDVGDKILGGKNQKSSVLSLMVEKKSDPYFSIFVGKENFIPAPKVESAVILFESHDRYDHIDDEKFLRIIKQGFTAVRKKLIKNFVNVGYDKGYILELFEEIGIDSDVRGEDLNIETWLKITEKIVEKN